MMSLESCYSKILPSLNNTQIKFTRNITLNIPLVSAAIDTVTKRYAQAGGIRWYS